MQYVALLVVEYGNMRRIGQALFRISKVFAELVYRTYLKCKSRAFVICIRTQPWLCTGRCRHCAWLQIHLYMLVIDNDQFGNLAFIQVVLKILETALGSTATQVAANELRAYYSQQNKTIDPVYIELRAFTRS